MTAFQVSQPVNIKATLHCLEAKGYVTPTFILLHVWPAKNSKTRNIMTKNDILRKIKANKQKLKHTTISPSVLRIGRPDNQHFKSNTIFNLFVGWNKHV